MSGEIAEITNIVKNIIYEAKRLDKALENANINVEEFVRHLFKLQLIDYAKDGNIITLVPETKNITVMIVLPK